MYNCADCRRVPSSADLCTAGHVNPQVIARAWNTTVDGVNTEISAASNLTPPYKRRRRPAAATDLKCVRRPAAATDLNALRRRSAADSSAQVSTTLRHL